MKVAIVEDEKKLAMVLKDYLVKENYTCDLYHDGSEALAGILTSEPDLILLDIMLPGTDGISVCREIRKHSDVPVIMLSARVEELDRLLGLEIGADDYICKPFSPKEVVARVKAVLRRSASRSSTDEEIKDASLTINEHTAHASYNGASCVLTAVELNLLQTLADHPGRIFNRNQLMTRIYPDNRIVSDRTIDSHVKKLRQKLLSLDENSEFIHSVYGLGYKLEVEPKA